MSRGDLFRRHTADVHTLIGPYVLDAVTEPERHAVERHRVHCPSCDAEIAELTATAARLADSTIRTPPEALRQRVLAEARRTRQEPPSAHADAVRRIGWHGWDAVAAVLLLVVFAVLVTYGVQQTRVDRARQQNAVAQGRQRDVAAVLAAPDATLVPTTLPDGARGRLVVSRSADRAVVTLTGLPALSGRHTYQLWLVSGSGRPASVGVLDVGTRSTTRVVSGIAAAEAFAVSTEPAGGSSRPTTIWASVPLTG
jgi:anti-sigma-K factor RskA